MSPSPQADVETLVAQVQAGIGIVGNNIAAFAALDALAARLAEEEALLDEIEHVLDGFDAPTESGGVTLNTLGRVRALRSKLVIEGNQRAGKLIDRAEAAELDAALCRRRVAELEAVADAASLLLRRDTFDMRLVAIREHNLADALSALDSVPSQPAQPDEPELLTDEEVEALGLDEIELPPATPDEEGR